MIITSTGWHWDYVAENIDMPRFKALAEYWSKHPPAHMCLGNGYDETSSGSRSTGSDDQLNQLILNTGMQ